MSKYKTHNYCCRCKKWIHKENVLVSSGGKIVCPFCGNLVRHTPKASKDNRMFLKEKKGNVCLAFNRTPISINNAYYFIRRGRRTIKVKSKEAKEFCKYVKNVSRKKLSVEPFPKGKKIELSVTLYFTDYRRHDIENYEKIMLDALKGILWYDDSQIFALHTYKVLGRSKPRTEIYAKEIEVSI